MSKAFEDAAFMHGEDARPLRILAEYLEPKQRLRDNRIERAITFWGSARIQAGDDRVGDGRDYYGMASDLGKRLAEWTMHTHDSGQRYHVLTGGGPGIMEAAHAGAAEVNARLNVGFNISLPFEQRANPYIPDDQVFEFHYFFTRKFWFLNLSAALVIFPGGFGTLDELFELLTLTQTGKTHARPIVLFGESYWREVINLEALARQALIEPKDLELVRHVDCVDRAFDILTHSLQ